MSKRSRADGCDAQSAAPFPESEHHGTWPKFLFATMLLGVALAVALAKTYRHPGSLYFIGPVDSWWLEGPNQFFLDRSLGRGEFPLWNPLILCGMPFAANPQHHVFYPPNLIRSLLTRTGTPLATHIGIALLIAAHLWLAGIGVLALARSHGLSYPASMLAALGLILSRTWVASAFVAPILVLTGAWFPWLLFCVHKLLLTENQRSRIRWLVAAAVVYGLGLLSGFITLMVYVSIAAALYAAACSWWKPSHTGGLTFAPRLRRAGKRLLRFGVAVLLGALLATALLLPASELTSQSMRSSKISAKDVLAQQGMAHVRPLTLQRLFEALVAYHGIRGWNASNRSISSGVIVALLALASLISKKRRDVLIYIVLAYVLFDCSRGRPWPFASMVGAILPFRMSVTDYAVVGFSLPLAMLAGFGLDAVTDFAYVNRSRIAVSGAITALAAWALWVVATQRQFPHISKPLVVAVPCIACLAILTSLWLKRWRQVWRIGITVACFGELAIWTFPVPATGSWRIPRTVEQLRAHPTFSAANRRQFSRIQNQNLYDLRSSINGYDPLLLSAPYAVLSDPTSKNVYLRFITSRALRKNARYWTFLKRPFWLARQYVQGPLPRQNRLYPVTTTVFLQSPNDIPITKATRGMLPDSSLSANQHIRSVIHQPFQVSHKQVKGQTEITFQLPKLTLSRQHCALQATYSSAVAGHFQARAFYSSRDSVALRDIEFQPSPPQGSEIEWPLPDRSPVSVRITAFPKQSKMAPRLTKVSLVEDEADEDALIHVREYHANRVVVDLARLPGPRVLLFVDAAYPGWTATVDNQRVPILRANDAFKAVFVPPGAHRVVFTFDSWRITAGVLISVLTALGCAAIALWPRAFARLPRLP